MMFVGRVEGIGELCQSVFFAKQGFFRGCLEQEYLGRYDVLWVSSDVKLDNVHLARVVRRTFIEE